MQLGLVTYQWGAEWNLETLLKNCAETGFAGLELRTLRGRVSHALAPALPTTISRTPATSRRWSVIATRASAPPPSACSRISATSGTPNASISC